MNHVTVVPMMACFPVSHMGHAMDIKPLLDDLPGKKFIGLSKKNEVFTEKERKLVLETQWNPSHDYHILFVDSVGETIRTAYDSFNNFLPKTLHLVVGYDRKDWGLRLCDAIHDNRIPELVPNSFYEFHLYNTSERNHSFSGTNLRQAVLDEQYDIFKEHLGPYFLETEAKAIYSRIRRQLTSNNIKVKRS